MPWYSATCNGGPYDGKKLHHPEPRYELVKRRDIKGFLVQAYQPGYEMQPGDERGSYVHTGNRWEWTRE